jgi:hypothetical protein
LPALPNSSLGSYSVFADGVTTDAVGTVIVDRFTLDGVAFIPNETTAGLADGTTGLGSEADTITVNGQHVAFSDQTEPGVILSIPVVPVSPPPSTSNVITAEIDQIYADVLGRAPDASGLATYSAMLEDGATTASIRAIISQSPEAQNDLNQLFLQVLGRNIDPSGDATYTSFINNGASLADVELILGQSPEAQADLETIYEQELNRAADPGGLVTYMGLLSTGTSLQTVRSVVAQSAEAQNDLDQLFQNVIGRLPDAAELAGMEDQLAAGSSQSSLETALASSGSAGGYTTITAAAGSTTLSALAGTPTQFDFSNVAFGNDTIAGFDPSTDAIKLPASLATSFAALQGGITAAAGGALITFNATQSILISGVAPGSLTASNFLL